jgi:trimethylamine:corrinoid methyltransferase-like protein
MLLCGLEYQTFKEEQVTRIEAAEMRLLRTVGGYKITNPKSGENITEEMGMAYISIAIWVCQKKWVEHL